MWIDNFSKIISRSVPSFNGGVFSQCLWTGSALFNHPDSNIDDKVKYSDGQVVAAMPDDLFNHKDYVMSVIKYMTDRGRTYFDKSLVKKYTINNVPLKVNIQKFPQMSEIMGNPANSFSRVFPADLIDINIGSNAGLASVIRMLYNERDMGTDECKRYLSLNVDENIFYRILKVVYIYVYTYLRVYIWSYILILSLFFLCFYISDHV